MNQRNGTIVQVFRAERQGTNNAKPYQAKTYKLDQEMPQII